MAIQMRRGAYEDFDSSKMLAGEIAVVTSGDPASDTGRTLYVCFAPGVVKRIVSYEDFESEINNATADVQAAFTEELKAAIADAVSVINDANATAEAAKETTEKANQVVADAQETLTTFVTNVQVSVDTAILSANDATEAAIAAAKKANEAAGDSVDISNTAIEFAEADTRENVASGETLPTLFGKIKKWFTDLKTVAFSGSYNDLSDTPDIETLEEDIEDIKDAIGSTSISEVSTTITGAITALLDKFANYVPTTRTVNSKALSANITLSASDVSAAPASHASTATTYGQGTSSNYGHVKVSDSYTSSAGAASAGVAASSQAVYNVYNKYSVVGTYKSASNSSDVSIATSTGKAIASISLDAGTWLVIARVRFSSNTSGNRTANLSATSGDSSAQVQAAPAPSGVTNLQLSAIFRPSATTTYYLNAYQTSGSTLTCASGMGLIYAVRII